MHSERDLVSFHWDPGSTHPSECSFLLPAAVVASLLDYLLLPAVWRWSSAAVGWVRTADAILTVNEVRFAWAGPPGRDANLQIAGSLIDHHHPGLGPSDGYALLATLHDEEIQAFAVSLRTLTTDRH